MGQGMRMALKGSTPSARARLKYITRQGEYAQGVDGPRADLAATGSGNLPNWADDAAQFWQGVDQFERSNARRCVELELNLPPELTLDQQRQVVEAYVERLLGVERMPYTWAIHDSSGKNPHCHLMFQERGLDGIDRPDGQAWFKRANTKQPELGGAKKSRNVTGATWTMHARATWADTANDGLKAAGHEPRFDHRSKAAQRDEALRNGDLRRATALGTLTEKHEGATIHGMRRRVERREAELDDLPDYARDLIQQNDRARAYNNALRDWARTAPDEELAERLAPDLAELREQLDQENPGTHVAAWQLHQEQLLQQHAAEREQAHAVALVEWVERARARAIELKPAAVRPAAVDRLIDLKRTADAAAAEARGSELARQVWRQEYPRRAALADALGIPLVVDRAAREAREAAMLAASNLQNAPEGKPAAAWQRACRELKAIQEQMPAMERAAGLEPQIEQEARSRAQLGEAARDLRRAAGLINNELTWCEYQERAQLHQLRREIEQQQRELERLRESLPAPADAVQVRSQAAQRLRQVDCWREAESAAKAAAEAQRLRELEQIRKQASDAPGPRGRGPSEPRMG
jgi:hypothetical protein